ncbi:similar to Saccharomyces cerevisiae YOR172W YRM1 Zn2-Cys6 zinc-finger transcription factor that activates genes involved in multidrug resistance [Maudiozyma saulgeensis]|uniref:Similar to Saccharomyces cerevisiae YOR172W YRM1 Zn2-Cys6 zinc-finger transcription factor that activates genes involved in multidrug resistance n=1 Tax=Maudiozyma saulgeensis TaxID=1789683 RepID=A0A1X7R361_9SACH|nr:similar to Saccharomyces cerevisiae YOR172W YRM1 Zn2-Cys6 zinc-finger transcription factor that activates genes involved in multidrug resistance [Kazachstania saulgeensis]
MSSEQNVVQQQRKRRRIPKSCEACRVKKLKCDRVRPRCSSCIIRQISDCQYEEDRMLGHGKNRKKKNNDDDDDEGDEGDIETKNSAPKKKILLNGVSNSSRGHVNPFASMVYVHRCLPKGKIMVQGPTSLKSFVANIHPPFTEKFEQLWRKTEPERLLWQDEHKETIARTDPLKNMNGPLLGSETSILELCSGLPDYQTLLESMNQFFSGSPLYDISTILSKSDTMEAFHTSFIPDGTIWKLQDRLVKKIGMPVGPHHYQLGILLMINRLVHCKENIDPKIEIFLNNLENQSQANGCYISQCQFLLLRWYHRKIYFTKIDDVKLLNLVNLIVDTSMNLGLQLDIEKIYAGDANIQLLKNMWYWIQFADLSISFQFGRQLKISATVYKNFPYNDTEESSFIKKLNRFLKTVREPYDSIYDQTTSPDLLTSCEQITHFLTIEFPNISDYFRNPYEWKVAVSELRILTLALGILIAMYGLRFKMIGERTLELKNNFTQITLISFKLITDILEHCWRYDNEFFLNLVTSSNSLTPFLTLAISLSEGLFQRAHMNFMSLIYYKITLFNEGYFRPYDLQSLDWDLSTLETRNDKNITINTAFELYTGIFSRWRQPAAMVMKGVLKRSYSYFLMILLQKISRMIVEKVIQFRLKSEETVRYSANVDGAGVPSQNTENYITKNSTSNETADGEDVPYDEKTLLGTQLNSQVSDEFWGSFNDYWEELLKNDYNLTQDFI